MSRSGLYVCVVALVISLAVAHKRAAARRPLFVGKRVLSTQAACFDDIDCPIDHCCSITPNGLTACAPERKLGDICTLSKSDERVVSEFHAPTCSCGRGLECTSIIGQDFGFCLPTRVLLADAQ